MQRKFVIDTNIYIDIFNHNKNTEQINWLQNITFLAWPVLHELWMGARTSKEVNFLTEWSKKFANLNRLILPTPSSVFIIGKVCHQLRTSGKLDPTYPKHYNDICIAILARQIGATLLTQNEKDFRLIQAFINFKYETAS